MTDYPHRKYADWPTDEHARWIHAGHTFGMHLMENIRNAAIGDLPDDINDESKKIALTAIDGVVYKMMAFFDGIYRFEIDDITKVEYALMSRIEQPDGNTEEFEIGPNGDGLCMAIHGWLDNEYWND